MTSDSHVCVGQYWNTTLFPGVSIDSCHGIGRLGGAGGGVCTGRRASASHIARRTRTGGVAERDPVRGRRSTRSLAARPPARHADGVERRLYVHARDRQGRAPRADRARALPHRADPAARDLARSRHVLSLAAADRAAHSSQRRDSRAGAARCARRRLLRRAAPAHIRCHLHAGSRHAPGELLHAGHAARSGSAGGDDDRRVVAGAHTSRRALAHARLAREAHCCLLARRAGDRALALARRRDRPDARERTIRHALQLRVHAERDVRAAQRPDAARRLHRAIRLAVAVRGRAADVGARQERARLLDHDVHDQRPCAAVDLQRAAAHRPQRRRSAAVVPAVPGHERLLGPRRTDEPLDRRHLLRDLPAALRGPVLPRAPYRPPDRARRAAARGVSAVRRRRADDPQHLEFGVPALGASVAAIAWTAAGAPDAPLRLRRLALAAAAGVTTAVALVCLVTLARAGSLPQVDRLTDYSRLFAVAGFALMPVPGLLGLHLVIYLTHAAAIVVGTVRAAGRAQDRLLTGMLVWSGIFGLGSGTYYIGRSHPLPLKFLFSAWALTLALLTIVVVRELAQRRRLSIAAALVLLGFGVAACSIAQAPTPWGEAHRLDSAYVPTEESDNGPRPLAPPTDPIPRRFVSAIADGPHRFVYARGAPIAIMLRTGHRIADAYGVRNVSPYSGIESAPTVERIEAVLDALERAGGNTLILPNPVDAGVFRVLERRGFRLVTHHGLDRYDPTVPHGDAVMPLWPYNYGMKCGDTRHLHPEWLRR